MLIAIDFDDTYTLDPKFWDWVIEFAKANGHRVICVTGRGEMDRPEVESYLGNKVEAILCTYGEMKRDYAEQQGYQPSVWIDDSPYFIEGKRGLP